MYKQSPNKAGADAYQPDRQQYPGRVKKRYCGGTHDQQTAGCDTPNFF